MIKKISSTLNLVTFLAFGFLQAQNPSFAFKSTLSPTTQTWHRIELPYHMYQHVEQDFRDIRILGTDKAGKTIEVPFIVGAVNDAAKQENLNFEIFNQAKQANAHYFTLKAKPQQISFIQLDFANQNFDWKVSLDGSINGKDWYHVLANERLLSIENQHTQYRFTDLHFPTSEYEFYRLKIESNETPILRKAMIEASYIQAPLLKDFPMSSYKIEEDIQNKTSLVYIDLPYLLPVSSVKLTIADTLDYNRFISIQSYAKNNQKNYQYISNGYLSSDKEATYRFETTLTQQLLIRIQNDDNQPLTIKNVIVKGNPYQLIARFPAKGNYTLDYGNPEVYAPQYDIEYFKEKIPNNLAPLTILRTEELSSTQISNLATHNKLWLWLILGALIAILGWFSYKMLLHSPKN